MIAHDGRPVLSNFGFSGLIWGANTTSLVLADVRWIAPEVLSSEEGEREVHTKASDVWAFGMVLYVCVGIVYWKRLADVLTGSIIWQDAVL